MSARIVYRDHQWQVSADDSEPVESVYQVEMRRGSGWVKVGRPFMAREAVDLSDAGMPVAVLDRVLLAVESDGRRRREGRE